MDLTLVKNSKSESDLYRHQLESALRDITPTLLERDVWDKRFVEKNSCFTNTYVGERSPIVFEGMPSLLALELKLYWAKLLADPRMDSRSNVDRRRLPMIWFAAEGNQLLKAFDASCLADIEHPEFPHDGHAAGTGKRSHNQHLIDAFSSFQQNAVRSSIEIDYVKSGTIQSKEYPSPRITIVGDFHKKAVIYREQFLPLSKRNIVFVNDIYTERDVRFKDAQRLHDQYINFYHQPSWIRAAIREHTFQKVAHGELSPSTLPGYVSRLGRFREFMHERFPSPSPELISDTLLEDEFIAWGNKKGLTGKNWFTDCIAMLNTASRAWPDKWPALSVSSRASRKIEKVHYRKGLGRIGHNQEGLGRAYSQRVIDELMQAAAKAPDPVFSIFALILSTGMRAEDGHAILFDCLKPDPNDDAFMLLTFWQNKVRKWNDKPLHKQNPAHAEIINIIELQRERILKENGRPTKYLFPTFSGAQESFLDPSYSMKQIKLQCVKQGILADDGAALSFSWHPLRHTKGTSLAEEGHDILSIMMELGHTSPDMATVYINNRLELKKKALLEHGGGRFYTIEGQVDERMSTLMVRKDQISATRVCGGACVMPAQIGDWCEHANACYTCKQYRADAKDVGFFKVERSAIIKLIEEQEHEVETLEEHGRTRMSEITTRRLKKNIEIVKNLETIIAAIEADGAYAGTEQKFKQLSLEPEE